MNWPGISPGFPSPPLYSFMLADEYFESQNDCI